MARPVHPFTVTHRAVWAQALPATFAFVTEPLAGLVDLAVIGRLGDAALLGGLVLGVLVFDFLFSLAFFIRLGTAGLVAQAIGAKEPLHGLQHLVRAVLVAVALGLGLILFGPAISWLSLTLLAPEADVRPAFEAYVGVRLLSAPLVFVNFALLGFLYGRGKAVTGLLLQVLVHGGNMLFSILFVYGLGWGVGGVATGTVIAQAIAMVAGLLVVFVEFGGPAKIWALVPNREIFDARALGRLFGLSRDLMIRSAALMGAFAFFTAQTARAGTLELGANALVLNFMMITAYLQDGQAQAAEQLCGKAVGANYPPAFDQAVKLTHLWGYAISAVLFAFWMVAGPSLIDLMTTAEDVRALARDYVFVAALTTITGVMPFVMDGVLIGATLNKVLRNGMVAALLVYLAVASLLQPLFGLMGIWAALHIWFITRGLIFLIAIQRLKPRLFDA